MKYSVTAVMLFVAAITPCFGQQATKPYTVISGKDHPELIDDATAYWHFFSMLGRQPGDTQDRYDRRRHAFANQTGLTGDEITSLLAASDLFAQQMQTLKQGGWVDPAVRGQVVLGVAAQLQQALGAHGAFLLTEFVNGVVKRNIEIHVPNNVPAGQ